MTLAIKVFGVQDCLEAFNDLPRTIRAKHMRVALNAGGGVIRDAAVSLAPKETGLLRKSIKVKVSVPEASYNPKHWARPAYAVVGPARRIVSAITSTAKGRLRMVSREGAINAAFRGKTVTRRRASRYAHLVERGTKPHGISANNAAVLSSGIRVFGRSVRHPGSKAQNFMTKAVQTAGSAAQNRMLAKLYQGIADWASARHSRVLSRIQMKHSR